MSKEFEDIKDIKEEITTRRYLVVADIDKVKKLFFEMCEKYYNSASNCDMKENDFVEYALYSLSSATLMFSLVKEFMDDMGKFCYAYRRYATEFFINSSPEMKEKFNLFQESLKKTEGDT